MKPRRIIIIRHGQSASNADKAVSGHLPDHQIPLTAKGREQARAAGLELQTWLDGQSVGVWVSPYYRTRQTAAEILGVIRNPLFVREDPRIREQEWGHLRVAEENHRIDNERDAYSKFWYRIPDGESGADVFDRISTFLETLHRDFAKPHPRNLIIVTHGYTSRIILMRWLHQTVEEFESQRNPPNCGYYVLELQRTGKYKLVDREDQRQAQLRA